MSRECDGCVVYKMIDTVTTAIRNWSMSEINRGDYERSIITVFEFSDSSTIYILLDDHLSLKIDYKNINI